MEYGFLIPNVIYFLWPTLIIINLQLVEGADSDSAELSGLFNEMDKNAVDLQTFFDEMIDIDMDDEEAVKIEVPKFGANRQGRFIHDFRFVSNFVPFLIFYVL